MKVTNISLGSRGVNTKGGVVILAAGETQDVELRKSEADTLSKEWFETSGRPVADPLDHDHNGKKGGFVQLTSEQIEDMTVPQLKAYAEEHSIDLGDATKRDDIIAAIQLHEPQA